MQISRVDNFFVDGGKPGRIFIRLDLGQIFSLFFYVRHNILDLCQIFVKDVASDVANLTVTAGAHRLFVVVVAIHWGVKPCPFFILLILSSLKLIMFEFTVIFIVCFLLLLLFVV